MIGLIASNVLSLYDEKEFFKKLITKIDNEK